MATIFLTNSVGQISMTSNYGDGFSPEIIVSAANLEAVKVFNVTGEGERINYKVALKRVNLIEIVGLVSDTYFMDYVDPLEINVNGDDVTDAQMFMDWFAAAIESGNVDGELFVPKTDIATDFTVLNDTKIPSTSAVSGYVQNAVAASNPTIAVKTATKAILPNSPTYTNGSSGIGAKLTAGSNAALVVNGYAVSLNDRILVKNQAAGLQNGIYKVTVVGSGAAAWELTRATDYDEISNVNGGGVIPCETYVNASGDTETNTLWLLTSSITAIGTDAFVYTSYTLGSNIVAVKTENITQFETCTGAELDALISDKTPAFIEDTNKWQKAQAGTFTLGSDGATITLDFSASNHFRVVLGGARTLGVPSNLSEGQSGVINMHQDGTGSRTLAFAWCFIFANGSAPTLSTGKYVMDQLTYMVNKYTTGAFTVTLATPGLFTRAGHGFISGQRVQLTTTGALPTGLSTGTTYFVFAIDADTFRLSISLANLQAGTYINTSGSQSGVHSVTMASITISMLQGVTA